MADVVVTLPIQIGEESTLFGRYLNTFMESRSFEADEMAQTCDAPFMMVRSDPGDGQDIKVLIFQHTKIATDFSTGWAQTVNGGWVSRWTSGRAGSSGPIDALS